MSLDETPSRRMKDKSDEQLLGELSVLNDREAASLAAIIEILGEVYERRAVEPKGFPSLFRYCTVRLRYSEDQACMRIRAAVAARTYRRILGMIASKAIGITALSKLAPHLTPENYRSVLERAAYRSIDEVEALVAELAPRHEPRPLIKVLRAGPRPTAPDTASPAVRWSMLLPIGESGSDAPSRGMEPPTTSPSPPQEPASSPPATRPPARYLFRFAASAEFHTAFERARELMRHKHPSGDPEGILADALQALLDKKDPSRLIARRLSRERRAARRLSAAGGAPPAQAASPDCAARVAGPREPTQPLPSPRPSAIVSLSAPGPAPRAD